MKNFIKKLLGFDKLEEEKEILQAARDKAVAETVRAQEEAEAAKEQERVAKLTPKERATANQEPYIAVLDTKVNPENPRNGFFELDWNEYFIVQLRQAGYGLDGDPDELVVDLWFRDLARNILAEEGQDITRGAGYINVVPISKGKLEVS